ncbi:MarR family transcriptional regulator [Kineococcus sp. T90]|nr:MarR family transcriptional regulator [Kineococcus indalonis]
MREDLAQRGLSQSRTHLLWALAGAGPSPQRVLAQALGISARSVTALVDALEATGFVSRQAHPRDRRAVLVTLTARGEAVVADLRTGYERLAEQLFGDLPAPRLELFTTTLAELGARLRTLVPPAGGSGRAEDGDSSPGTPGGVRLA